MTNENEEQQYNLIVTPSEPARRVPFLNRDNPVEADLKLTLITGDSYEFTTKFRIYSYGDVVAARHIHRKVDSLTYLTSSDNKTMFKMHNVVLVEVLQIRMFDESA